MLSSSEMQRVLPQLGMSFKSSQTRTLQIFYTAPRVQHGLYLFALPKIKKSLTEIEKSAERIRGLATVVYRTGQSKTNEIQQETLIITQENQKLQSIKNTLALLTEYVPPRTDSNQGLVGKRQLDYQLETTSGASLGYGPYDELPIRITTQSGKIISAFDEAPPPLPQGTDLADIDVHRIYEDEDGVIREETVAASTIFGEDDRLLTEQEEARTLYFSYTIDGQRAPHSSNRSLGAESAKSIAKQLGGTVSRSIIYEGGVSVVSLTGGRARVTTPEVLHRSVLRYIADDVEQLLIVEPGGELKSYMNTSVQLFSVGGTIQAQIAEERVLLQAVGNTQTVTSISDALNRKNKYLCTTEDLRVGDVVESEVTRRIISVQQGKITTDGPLSGNAVVVSGAEYQLDKILNSLSILELTVPSELETRQDVQTAIDFCDHVDNQVIRSREGTRPPLAEKQTSQVLSLLRQIIRVHQESGHDRAADYLSQARVTEYASLSEETSSYSSTLALGLSRFQAEIRL